MRAPLVASSRRTGQVGSSKDVRSVPDAASATTHTSQTRRACHTPQHPLHQPVEPQASIIAVASGAQSRTCHPPRGQANHHSEPSGTSQGDREAVAVKCPVSGAINASATRFAAAPTRPAGTSPFPWRPHSVGECNERRASLLAQAGTAFIGAQEANQPRPSISSSMEALLQINALQERNVRMEESRNRGHNQIERDSRSSSNRHNTFPLYKAPRSPLQHDI